MTSPYLLKPLRSLIEVQAERDAETARRRTRHLRTSSGQAIEIVLPLDVVKARDALERGLEVPE